MKKVLSIVLAVLMLASVIPYSIAAEETESTTTATTVPAPDLAYTTIGNAIATDAAAGTTTELAKTNWSFQYGSAKSNLTDYTVTGTNSFITDANRNNTPATTPTGYRFNSPSRSYCVYNVAAYNTETLPDAAVCTSADTMPSSGIAFSVPQYLDTAETEYKDDDYFAITYTAPQTGSITLSDPNGGRIAAIDKLGSGCGTNCVYVSGGGNTRNVKFGIYKNGERIWPSDDDFLFYHNEGTDRIFSVDFPTLENISVREGDKIQLIFDGTLITASATMTFALNPQVEYVYADTGDVNEDWDIDIRDLVTLNNQLDKEEPKYDSIFDLFRGDNKFVIDKLDLGALREFIIGKLTEF